MKLSSRLFVTASLIICGALISTSFSEPNAPKKAADANTAEPNAVKAVDSVAVTVDGKAIMESQVEEEIGPRLKSLASQVPPERLEQVKQQLRGKAVDGLVIKSLLDEQVAKDNIKVNDEEVTAEIAKQLKQQNMTEEDLKKILTMYGKSFEWYKKHIKQTLGYQKYFESKMSSADVNDAAAEAYYKANAEQFKTPEQVRASHILISTRPTDPNEDPNKAKAAAKIKAEDVLKQLQGGADFNDLAKKYSADPGSAAKGGDLGLFGRGMMVKEFEDTAFSQKTGQTSGLVETQFGYHIIKTTEHKDANTTSLEQAKPQIKEMLANQKKGEQAQKMVEDLKKNAKIEYPAGKEPVAPMAPMGQRPIAPAAPKDANAKN